MSRSSSCLAFALVFFLLGCRRSSDGTQSAADGGGNTTDGGVVQRDMYVPVQNDCTGIALTAPIGQACCLARGIDACAAGSSCAALDGRTVPVCYTNGSRVRGATCADIPSGSLCAPNTTCRTDEDGQQRCLRDERSTSSGRECYDDSECATPYFECSSAAPGTAGDCTSLSAECDDIQDCSAFGQAHGVSSEARQGANCSARVNDTEACFVAGHDDSDYATICVFALYDRSDGCSLNPCGDLNCSQAEAWAPTYCHSAPVCED